MKKLFVHALPVSSRGGSLSSTGGRLQVEWSASNSGVLRASSSVTFASAASGAAAISAFCEQRRWMHPPLPPIVPPPTADLDGHSLTKRLQDDPKFREQVLQALATTTSSPGASSSVAPPTPLTRSQWIRCAIRTGTPFFGFGICDNLIMLTVGDLIDTHFGVTLGFSTMIAAGLGQAVSDGAGITIQGSIDAYADKMGLPNPNLTPEQAAMPRVLFWQQVFRTVGIILGCLCGLMPVILFDTGNRPRLYDQLLNCLSPEQRKELSSRATYVFHSEGEYIFEYGQEADAMYTIVTGEVAVIGRSDRGDLVEFCRQGPGSNIGIIELAFGHRCVADVVVTTPTVKMLRVDRHDFEKSPRSDEIRRVVTKFVEEDDTFVVYRARHMIPAKNIDLPSRRASSSKQPPPPPPAAPSSASEKDAAV
jgi:hypothetical protein